MGSWQADQSKGGRRYVWGETRGKSDPTLRDFTHRARSVAPLGALRAEKIGSEIHCWREAKEPDSGRAYWISCFRFVDDGWGYWTVFFRADEGRWRTTPMKDLPLSQALQDAGEWFQAKAPALKE